MTTAVTIRQTLLLADGSEIQDAEWLRNQPVTQAEANRWITQWSYLLEHDHLPENIVRVVCTVGK